MAPEWKDGVPANLAAAAADADEWLALLEKMVRAGRAGFSRPDSMGRLGNCRAALARELVREATRCDEDIDDDFADRDGSGRDLEDQLDEALTAGRLLDGVTHDGVPKP